MFEVSRDLMIEIASLMNTSSSLLFFGNENLKDWTNSSTIGIVTVMDA